MKICPLLACLLLAGCGSEKTGVNPLGAPEVTTTTATQETTAVTVTETTTQPETKPLRKIKSKMLVDVPFYSQADYPTGCELVSTSMLLAFLGFDVKAGELIEKGWFDSVEVTKDDDGVKHSGDPDKVFIGNPEKDNGYGCHSGAVRYALNKYLRPQEYKTGVTYEIADLNGMSLEEICTEYVSEGVPVIVWASIDMKPTFINLANSWIIDKTGERYLWKSNEHCLVLTGYDKENYYFNDPLAEKNTPYIKPLAERRFMEMGCQAIAILTDDKTER